MLVTVKQMLIPNEALRDLYEKISAQINYLQLQWTNVLYKLAVNFVNSQLIIFQDSRRYASRFIRKDIWNNLLLVRFSKVLVYRCNFWNECFTEWLKYLSCKFDNGRVSECFFSRYNELTLAEKTNSNR